MKDEIKTFNNEGLKCAIVKRAFGYDTCEVVEEYAQSKDGEIVLTKKKVTTKNVPPDVSALKILLDIGEDELVENLTDEQLNAEMQRLLNLLNAQKEENKEKQNCKKALKTTKQRKDK